MSNYNSQLQSNNTDLQTVLQTLQSKALTSQAAPEISVSSSGLITAIAGTKSSTYQLAFQPAKTITPSTASQIAVSSGYYTGGDITVAAVPTQSKTVTPTSTVQNVTPDSGKFLSKVTINAIPSTYVQPAATKTATTYTPTTTAQTIASGTYLAGTQTIAGDSNLVAGNIKNGISIFGVNGNYEGGGDMSVEDGLVTRTLTSYTNDRVTTIGSYTFGYCTDLTTVSFPVTTTIGSYAFSRCTGLTTVSFPVAITIGGYAFHNCSKLTTVSFPAATTIGSYAFCSCTGLTTVSFPVATTIGMNAFGKCYNLKSLYLTGSSLCKLSNSNAFSSTPIGGYSTSAGTYGSIYVPASLLTSYQTATNWTYFSSRFVGI